jgi:ATP-dependent helicase HrpA
MPQRLRHKLGTLDEFAEAFLAAVPASDLPLAEALRRYVREQLNFEVPVDAFRPDSAPPHLHMNFRVIDEHGRQLGVSRNLAELKRELGEETEAVLQEDQPLEKHSGWTMGDLPELMELERGGHKLFGYPALVDVDDAVTLQVFDSPEKAREMHRGGVLRLLTIAFRDRVRDLERTLGKDITLGPLKGDIITAALQRAFRLDELPMTQIEFARRVDEGRNRFNLIAQEFARLAAGILAERAALEKKLNGLKTFPRETQDVRTQLDRLLASGWLARTPWDRLQHLPRYLKAASARLDKLRADPARDARLAADLASLEVPYRREEAVRARHGAVDGEFEQFGWLLEELRVSLFAQELKTPVPVSVKRLMKLWQTVRR